MTGREEWLPPSIGVVGARGSDGLLLELLRDMLETEGMRMRMRVRRMAFAVRGDGDVQGVGDSGLCLKQHM